MITSYSFGEFMYDHRNESSISGDVIMKIYMHRMTCIDCPHLPLDSMEDSWVEALEDIGFNELDLYAFSLVHTEFRRIRWSKPSYEY